MGYVLSSGENCVFVSTQNLKIYMSELNVYRSMLYYIVTSGDVTFVIVFKYYVLEYSRTGHDIDLVKLHNILKL